MDVGEYGLAFLPQEFFMVPTIMDSFVDGLEGDREIVCDLFRRTGLWPYGGSIETLRTEVASPDEQLSIV